MLCVRTVLTTLLPFSSRQPAIHLIDALEAVRGLLQNPNHESPLNVDAGLMLRDSAPMFAETATTWTHHFANGIYFSEFTCV